MRSGSPFGESRNVPSPTWVLAIQSLRFPRSSGAWFRIAFSLARRRFHWLWQVIFRCIAAPDARFCRSSYMNQGCQGNSQEFTEWNLPLMRTWTSTIRSAPLQSIAISEWPNQVWETGNRRNSQCVSCLNDSTLNCAQFCA